MSEEQAITQDPNGYKPKLLSLNKLLNNLFSPSRPAFLQTLIAQAKKFPDVSFYQGEILWDVMRSKTDAVIVRAGQNLWKDTQFDRNWAEAKRLGMKRGVYFFYDDRIDPSRQAALLVSLIRDDLPEMEVWCDWERSYGGAFSGLRNVVAFMQAVESSLPTVKTGLYTGYYWFRGNSNVITNASQYTYLRTRPLWLAWYSDAANVLIPAPWTSLLLWQYGTPVLDYGQRTLEIDMNYFNGSLADFNTRYNTIPTEEPMEQIGTVTATVLNMRTGPNPSVDNIIGTLARGDRAIGTIDALWMHITKVIRVNGAIEVWDSFANSVYMTLEPYVPTPVATLKHTIKVYNNGSIQVDDGSIIP